MAIVTYPKTNTTKLTKNFAIYEFSCHGNGCCSTVKIDSELAACLQKIRDHFGKPVHINSGYRCPKHNKAVGGATNSYHTTGQAADIVVEGVSPAEVAKYAESIGMLGIGQYSNFTHVDTRTTKYYWIDSKGSVSTFGGEVTPVESDYDQTQFIKDLQKIFGLSVTGVADTTLLDKTVTISAIKNYRHPAVTPIQKRLYALGYTEIGKADGIAGSKFKMTIKNYQSDNSCVSDGEMTARKKTWKKILGLK